MLTLLTNNKTKNGINRYLDDNARKYDLFFQFKFILAFTHIKGNI